jgi:hypothetical protein
MPTYKPFYEVVVGNVGKVYEGSNYKSALRAYGNYVRASQLGHGRAGGESVSLWKDNEPIKEHVGRIDNPHATARDIPTRWTPATVKRLRGGKVQIKIQGRGRGRTR